MDFAGVEDKIRQGLDKERLSFIGIPLGRNVFGKSRECLFENRNVLVNTSV